MNALAQIFRRVMVMAIGRRRLEKWLRALEQAKHKN